VKWEDEKFGGRKMNTTTIIVQSKSIRNKYFAPVL
jgi:hypothetical protein